MLGKLCCVLYISMLCVQVQSIFCLYCTCGGSSDWFSLENVSVLMVDAYFAGCFSVPVYSY